MRLSRWEDNAAQRLVFDLSPGQSLHIPSFWLHRVCSIGPSASISMWHHMPEQLRARQLLRTPIPLSSSVTSGLKDRMGQAPAAYKRATGELYKASVGATKARYLGLYVVPMHFDCDLIMSNHSSRDHREQGWREWEELVASVISGQPSFPGRLVLCTDLLERVVFDVFAHRQSHPMNGSEFN